MKQSSFEIWGDTGLSPPYILIVIVVEGAESKYDVIDPQDNGKCVYSSKEYDYVRTWLLEDEYVRLSERILD